ncbi:MAG TPA: hypothetical protein VI072_24190 [Polyangiaceae bacterium]
MTDTRLAQARGRRLHPDAAARISAKLTPPKPWLDLLQNYPIVGIEVSLSEDDDESGMGAEMRIMDDTEVLSEAFETYPGLVAVPMGYVPFAICLEGSGDPYFIRSSDGAVVRIPHDAVDEDELDESSIELIARSLDNLFEKAALD